MDDKAPLSSLAVSPELSGEVVVGQTTSVWENMQTANGLADPIDRGLSAAAARRSRADLDRVATAASEYVNFVPARAINAVLVASHSDLRLEEIHLRLMVAITFSISARNGLSFRSYDQLAQFVGKAVKSVRNACSQLEKWSYIARTDPRSKNAKGMKRTMDTALRPAGQRSWEDLQAIITDWTRLIRHRDATLAKHLQDKQQGAVEREKAVRPQARDDEQIRSGKPHTNVPNCRTMTATNVPQPGTSELANVPTGTLEATHSISSLTGQVSRTGLVPRTGTRVAPVVAFSQSPHKPELIIAYAEPVEASERFPSERSGRRVGGDWERERSGTPTARKQRLDRRQIRTDEWMTIAVEIGVPEAAIPWELNKFCDYHEAKGSVMADWTAAWRGWCRKTIEFSASAGPKRTTTRVVL